MTMWFTEYKTQMDFKHKKTCSISFMIKGMKIKITQISFAYIWQKLKFLQNLNDQGHGGTGRHSHRLLATKGYKPWEEESLWRLNDPAIRKLITKTVTKGKQLHV